MHIKETLQSAKWSFFGQNIERFLKKKKKKKKLKSKQKRYKTANQPQST
jgi:hypothetical protein